jgi:hypothetical protein
MKKSYENFGEQWNKIVNLTLDEEDIRIGSEYYEEKMMELYEEAESLEYESDTCETEIID